MSEEGSKGVMCTYIISIGGGAAEEGRNKGQSSDIEDMALQSKESLENMADGENSNAHVVDIDKWAHSLEMILQSVPQYMSTSGHPGRISRIPENLREIDRKAYEPYILSVGPYHHGNPRVQRMEKTKQAVLSFVLQQNPEIKLKDYLKEIKSIESAARSFYSDVEMDSGKFVQMLLLDSMYIVTALCGTARSCSRKDETNTTESNVEEMTQRNEGTENLDNEQTTAREDADNENMEEMTQTHVCTENVEENEQMTAREDKSNDEMSTRNVRHRPRWFWALLAHDLLLIENQLPLFVLEKIYDLVHGGSGKQLIVTLKNEVSNLLSSYRTPISETVISPSEDVHHLLHLCHMFFRPSLQRQFSTCELPESSQMFRLGSAVQLYQAGVTFEVRSSSSQHTLLDITFGNSGKMVMPCLHVEGNTVSLLRNLIALEQMKYPHLGLNVSAYVVFLLHLITTPDDVRLLRRVGIIQHHLASDKEMVYLVNKLSVGLSFDYAEDMYNMKPVFQKLKRYSERRVPRWSAWLKHTYFNNPWTAISLLAASLLLMLTVVQTYYWAIILPHHVLLAPHHL